MEWNTALKIPDAVIILLALALTGFSFYAAYSGPREAPGIRIQGQDRTWVFPLSAEETIRVQGPAGVTVLRIHGGEAWVESSPCKNQSCVAAGRVSAAGSWAACLPNSVFLMVEGTDGPENTPDSISW